MATEVLIAHTGQRLRINTTQLASLDDFKASVARQSSIPAQSIITLTSEGRPLKLQTIQTEKEIYVYDKRLTQAAPPTSPSNTSTNPVAQPPDVQIPPRYQVIDPPNSLHDDEQIQSWQDLFEARRAWAVKLFEDCNSIANTAHERYGEMDVMLRCLDAAIANLESVVKGLEPRFGEVKKWLPGAQADYKSLTTGWEQYLSLARSIPISSAMVQFMTGRVLSAEKGRLHRQASLEDLVDLDTARKAGRLAPAALRKFNTRVADLEKTSGRLFQDAQNLVSDFEIVVARSPLSQDNEVMQLLEDIEAVAQKVNTDCQTIHGYTESAKDVTQASRIAANHTENLLPSLCKRSLEMDDMLREATLARNTLANETVNFMRAITSATALSHTVKSLMSHMHQEDELATFDYLRLIQQLPFMYASFVAEAVKRREWFDKVKQDSSTLANEMAVFQDEEVKRRKRWQKSVGNAYGPEHATSDSAVPGLEINLQGEEEQWPDLTRADLEEFNSLLQKQAVDSNLLNDLNKLVGELNNPTKQQSRRLKAFKNGSIHEASVGRSGLLIRGDDDLLRSLQEDKAKVESKLRTAESRVRRLEDLLHRQSQASRPSPGSLFQIAGHQIPERVDSPISSSDPRYGENRRASSDASDALVRRIQLLEAELDTEKARAAVLEKDLSARITSHDAMAGQMDEANSTKRDLMENMEALKREFVEERKSLEDEVKRLQARLEDAEDEIDHFGESRENEKVSQEDKIRALELQIERLVKEMHDDALKAEGQVEFLRTEGRLQRESAETQARQLLAAQENAQNAWRDLESLREDSDIQLRTLRDLHAQFLPAEPIPDHLNDLIAAIGRTLTEVVAKIQNGEHDRALLRADLVLSQNTARSLRVELDVVTEGLSKEETNSRHLREKLQEEQAKVVVLEGEVNGGREQLSHLRNQLADGEMGSETLQRRLTDQESKVLRLDEELASRQSQVGSLGEELRLAKEKLEECQARASQLLHRFNTRGERAKDLTQRLYSQNDRLCRLLERLGFSVARQDGGGMTIQRIPRSERSPQYANEPDLGSSLRRSSTLLNGVSIDESELELLYWMNSEVPEVESERYEAYLSRLGSFDIDAFSETLYKRVKDIEHMARKLQRDARSYKERAHTLQKESHEKIAFKQFKEGDLALFLPTRNQTTGAWAAFNIGFPHYFLREQEAHRLQSREWLLARISRVQERVVDLSKALQQQARNVKKGRGSVATAETDSVGDEEDENPFDLSDGLRWYLIDASEDKPGAPSTPGLAKSTVAANNVEAMAEKHSHIRLASKGGRTGIPSGIEGVSKSLSKSLESRRSSTGSRKALPFSMGASRGRDSALASETNSLRAAPAETPLASSPTQQQPSATGPDAAAAQNVTTHGTAAKLSSSQTTTQTGDPSTTKRTLTAGEDWQHGHPDHPPISEVRNVVDALLGP